MTTKIPAELSSTPGISDSSNATAITIDSNENVAIGSATADPLSLAFTGTGLTINEDSGTAFIQVDSGNGSRIDFGVSGSRNTTFYADGSGSEFSRTSNHPIHFKTNNTERMRIDSSGNVGIGTSSPSRNLHINGTGDVHFAITNGNTGTSSTDGFNITVESPTPDVVFRQRENNNMRFLTNNTERMRIDSSGNFLHGGTSAFATGVTSLRTRTLSSKDFAEIAMAGEYATNDTLVVYDTTNSATRFKVNYQGTVFATATTISSLSDERLKENIIDLDKGLSDILKLKPRRFDWKSEEGSGKTGVTGFIAQECEEAGFEEFVDTVDFSETIKNVKTFGYGGLVPALVKAIQEQQEIIEDLKSRIETLEG